MRGAAASAFHARQPSGERKTSSSPKSASATLGSAPPLAEHEVPPDSGRCRHLAHQRDDAVAVAPRVGDVDVEEVVREPLRVGDEEPTPERAASVPRRVRQEPSSDEVADERQADAASEHPRRRARHSRRGADEREPLDAVGRLRARTPSTVDRRSSTRQARPLHAERMEDVGQEGGRVREDADAAVVERVCEAVTGPVDD